jgi:hypothetical protein
MEREQAPQGDGEDAIREDAGAAREVAAPADVAGTAPGGAQTAGVAGISPEVAAAPGDAAPAGVAGTAPGGAQSAGVGDTAPRVAGSVFGSVAALLGRLRGRPLAVSVTALAAMAVLTVATIAQSPDNAAGSDARPAAGTASPTSAPAATDSATAATATPSASGPTPTASSDPTGAPTSAAASARATASPAAASDAAATAAARVRAAIDALPGTGDLAVAVTDLDGDGADAGTAYDTSDEAGNTYDTASIVKVDILAALLLRHQDAGTHLTDAERGLATAMIERSDNDAATALWDTVGGAAGLAAANRTLGLTATDGGAGELWGLTQTTPGDQLTLLRAVFGDGDASPLSTASRAYVRSLMGAVTAGQRWGVSAADSDDAGFALKNGWLQRTATGLWDINSIGEVTYRGHRLLIAVLSSAQPTEAAGITLAESAARAAAEAYTAS